MKHVFDMPEPFRVPDATLVSPFLNPKDSERAETEKPPRGK